MAQMIVKCISDCLYGTGDWDAHGAMPAATPMPDVTLDSTAMGTQRAENCRETRRRVTGPGCGTRTKNRRFERSRAGFRLVFVQCALGR